MDNINKIIIYFELHDVEGIQTCFENGVNPNQIFRDKPLIYELINMYTRGPMFKECIRVFVDYGLEFEDKILLAVLLDEFSLLDNLLADNHTAIYKKYSLDCTFTPLYEVSLLHICAEYNHVACAKVLVKHGLDINVRAGYDEHGFGGHTPIFHTVNQYANTCFDMLTYFVTQNADLTLTVKGLIWGKGYDWETYIPSVNPMSYAMMGLLRQFQRTEIQIYEVVELLQKSAFGIEYEPINVPNKYLNSK